MTSRTISPNIMPSRKMPAPLKIRRTVTGPNCANRSRMNSGSKWTIPSLRRGATAHSAPARRGLHRHRVDQPRLILLMNKVIHAVLASIVLLVGVAGASAEEFPSRPITMLVPFSAGGPTDTIARVLADRMGKSLGQPVVVENLTGAGGTIAAGRVARAAADGYTLDLATWSTHVVTPVIYKLQYDVFRDFDPVIWL